MDKGELMPAGPECGWVTQEVVEEQNWFDCCGCNLGQTLGHFVAGFTVEYRDSKSTFERSFNLQVQGSVWVEVNKEPWIRKATLGRLQKYRWVPFLPSKNSFSLIQLHRLVVPPSTSLSSIVVMVPQSLTDCHAEVFLEFL
jgi:hypothetical protein